jgi:DNA-binding CsgD family transcriptional regulator
MIHTSHEELSTLIGKIYDCAVVPEGWSAALTQINATLEGAYTTISLADMQTFAGVMAAHSAWDPEMLRVLNDDYGIDGVPGLREVVFGPIDVPRSTMQQMDEQVFQASPFYQNWVKPQALRDACIAKFAQTGGRLGLLGVITSAKRDIINDEERSFIAMLSPHIRRAAMIGDLLMQHDMKARFYRSSFNSIGTPVVLVDGTARIIDVNETADALLAIGQPIARQSGQLTGSNAFATSALHDAIARAAQGDDDIGDRGIGIPLSLPRETPAVAYVLPVSRGAAREVLRPAAAAVFISSAAGAMPPPQDALVTLFNLTPAEATVLLQIGGGATPAVAAAEIGVSENTVKSHLQRVFAKTGTARQADLVKLLASLGPLKG